MFVLGDVKVRPSIDKVFLPSDPLGVYLQLYHFGLDQSTNAPFVQVTYTITSQGKVLREVIDRRGESIQFASGQRLVLIKGLSLKGLNPGEYVLKVHVRDGISQKAGGSLFRLRSGQQASPLDDQQVIGHHSKASDLLVPRLGAIEPPIYTYGSSLRP